MKHEHYSFGTITLTMLFAHFTRYTPIPFTWSCAEPLLLTDLSIRVPFMV